MGYREKGIMSFTVGSPHVTRWSGKLRGW